MNPLIILPEHGSSEHQMNNLSIKTIYFKKNNEKICLHPSVNGVKKIHSGYCVGLDWVDANQQQPVLVEPKVNQHEQETDLLAMMETILQSDKASQHISKAYEIKVEAPQIRITQRQDRLSMLLVIHFLQLTKRLVKRGLRRRRYTVTENLNGRVKGRVLVGPNMRKNGLNQRPDRVYCRYAVHGLDSVENRILKKTLLFAQRYIASHTNPEKEKEAIRQTVNQCLAAFASVGDEVSISEMQHPKPNPFYKEYGEALKLARLILLRFGYQLTKIETEDEQYIFCPPHWIDMPILFELYAMACLEQKEGIEIKGYQSHGNYGDADIILKEKGKPVVVDAKYKKLYQYNRFEIDDIRQVAAYTRDKKIRKLLGINDDQMLAGCIIYPYQEQYSDLLDEEISQFTKMYKFSISIPVKPK